MARKYLEIVGTPAVLRAQEHYYGRAHPVAAATDHDPLGANEVEFIAARSAGAGLRRGRHGASRRRGDDGGDQLVDDDGAAGVEVGIRARRYVVAEGQRHGLDQPATPVQAPFCAGDCYTSWTEGWR